MEGDDVQIELGRRIKEARKRRGLTQSTLADKINKTVDTVSNIERGRSAPMLTTAVDIAAVLEVDLVELFRGTPLPAKTKAHRAALEKIAAATAGCSESTLDAIVHVVMAIADLDPGRDRGRKAD